MTNSLFKQFLSVVLDLGNALNMGTPRGNAKGFKISSLQAISNMKSATGK